MARKRLVDRRVLLYDLRWIDGYGWHGRIKDIDDETEFIVRSEESGMGLYAARKDSHFYKNKKYDIVRWGLVLGRGEGEKECRAARKAIINTLRDLNVRVMKRRNKGTEEGETKAGDKACGTSRVWDICPFPRSSSTLNSTAGREAAMRSILQGNSNGLRPVSKKRASGNG